MVLKKVPDKFPNALQTFYNLKTNLELLMYWLSPAGPTEAKAKVSIIYYSMKYSNFKLRRKEIRE